MDDTRYISEIGERIKRIRKSKGYSQEYVSLQVNSNTARISMIENGKAVPDLLEITKIAKVLEIPLQSILKLNDDSFYQVETKYIINDLIELDQLANKNRSTILKRWFKTIHTEITDIMNEVKYLTKI